MSASETLTPRKRAKIEEEVRRAEMINDISEALGHKGPEYGRFSCVQDILWVTDLPIDQIITSDHFRLYTTVRGIFAWRKKRFLSALAM